MHLVMPVPVPPASRLLGSFQRVDFADAYQVRLAQPGLSAQACCQAVLGHSPAWVDALMRLRGLFAKAAGLKHSNLRDGQQQGLFKVQHQDAQEILLGEDDRHLNFRISVLRSDAAGHPVVIVSTAVQTHNALGRAYLRAVLPFHRVISRSMLQRAADAGRL